MKNFTKVIISKNEKTTNGNEVILEHNFPTKRLAKIFLDQFDRNMNGENLFIVKVY